MESSTPASIVSSERRRLHQARLPARLFGSAIFVSIAVLILLRADSVVSVVSKDWAALLLWALVIATIDLLPVDLGHIRLTLDMPILLAVALTFPPEVAALVALLAAFDQREFRGQVSISHALFNRSQIALSVFLASRRFTP